MGNINQTINNSSTINSTSREVNREIETPPPPRLMEDEENIRCQISVNNFTFQMLSNPQASLTYYLCGPLLTFFILIGVFGNALCIKSLMKGSRRTAAAINAYLIVLAGWDLSLVVASFFLYNLSVLLNGYVPVFGNYVRTYPIFFTLANASHTASIWCVVAMAAERYFALCHPLRHRRATLDHATRARRTLICISVLAIFISVPKFFEVDLIDCLDLDSGDEIPNVRSSQLRRSYAYSTIYIVIGGLLFHSLTPFLILAILSIRVIIEVRRGTIMHRQISVRRQTKKIPLNDPQDSKIDGGGNRSNRLNRNASKISTNFERSNSVKWSENRANEILPLAVIAKFFICHSLPTALDIFERLMNEVDFEGPTVDLLVDISNVLVVVNSSVNFLLYAACSVLFRRRMIQCLINCFCFCGCVNSDEDDDGESRKSSALSPPTKMKKDSDCVEEPLTADIEP